MSSVVIEYVYQANPGTDMAALMVLTITATNLWKKNGAKVNLWAVQVGDIGNMTIRTQFESSVKLGAALDALNSESAFSTWRTRSSQSGLARWVRSNQSYEIPI
jgi:hypothetical protein